MSIVLNLSVHDIVDVLMRKGHLDTRIFNQSSMQEGTRLHALYQHEQENGYIPEYALSHTFSYDDFIFLVSGKADGIILKDNGEIIVEEIKTTVADLDEFITDHGQWHLSQAMFYAYMIAEDKKAEKVTVLMTYLRQQNYRTKKQIRQTYTFEELSRFVSDLIIRYARLQERIQRFKKERDESLVKLPFPFQSYRPGQKEMMNFVTQASENHQEVYIQAPTGIGKTISVLYPLVCLFGKNQADKIIYLTSKNSIKKVAMATLAMFKAEGAKCKSIEFTSKQNLCFNDKKGHCNPDECPFARHYYDKLLDAIFDALETEDSFTRSEIERIALQRSLCPFEFQIDLSSYCDILVCDYTYVYDYHDHLCLSDGSMAGKKAYLCVDECHNLPDRVRDMYSCEIARFQLEEALQFCLANEFKTLKTDILDSLKLFDSIPFSREDERIEKEGVTILDHLPDAFVEDLADILISFKELMKKYPHLLNDTMMEFFYLINSFYYLATLVNDEKLGSSFLCYLRVDSLTHILSIRIANLNSRPLIQQGSDFFDSVIYFSATLSPKDYYIDLLGGSPQREENQLLLPSPFPKENRKVFVDTRLSLRYKDRDETLYQVFSLCHNALSNKKGNYFIFCPSFEYLDRLASFFDQEPLDDSEVLLQGRSMSEDQREEFLNHFQSQHDKTVIGLLVLGGVFSEGIDLLGDRLIGVVIISVGIPQLGFERNQLKDYYDKEDEENPKGFSYAYTYPGINRVLQAAGRVIRSEEDKGFILLIDSRFRQSNYQTILKDIYPDAVKVISPSQVRTQLKLFWKEKK